MGEGELAYKRYIDGDDSSFEEVVRIYRAEVTAYALSIVRNRFAAEDVAADVFCYVVCHKKKYNFSVPLKYYLLMICKSRALDYYRKEKKYLPLDEAISAGTERDNVVEIIVKEERKSAVYRAIGGLPAEMRSAVYLFYFEEMSYDDVAKIMKINKKKVDNLLYAAKQKLKKELCDL